MPSFSLNRRSLDKSSGEREGTFVVANARSYGPLSEEQFIALYPNTPNDRLAEMTGRGRKWLIMQAHFLGVKKDPALTAATRSRVNKASPNVRRGANHPNWNGGPGDERGKSPQANAWRDAVLERDDWTCQDCHVRFGKKSRGILEAHHVLDWVSYPARREDVSNGLTLCHACHWKRHGYQARGPEMKPCDCGCGREMVAYDSQRRLRHYLRNHSPGYRASRSHPMSEEARARSSATHKRLHATGVLSMPAHRGVTRGEDHPRAKLTEVDVRHIRARHAAGESAPAIARSYGVGATAVYSIIHGRAWKHVT